MRGTDRNYHYGREIHKIIECELGRRTAIDYNIVPYYMAIVILGSQWSSSWLSPLLRVDLGVLRVRFT